MFLTTVAILAVTLAAPASRDRKDTPVGLEQKLMGKWEKGGPCIGDITFRADGTYERQHFSPGNNTVSGKWRMRWDALPPTLVLTCEEADREDLIGKKWEMKVMRLDDDELHFEINQKTAGKFKRPKK
jgi:hypothetical protein